MEDLIGLFVGLAIGFIAGVAVFFQIADSQFIDPCELNLPRTEKCVLTAIPERLKEGRE